MNKFNNIKMEAIECQDLTVSKFFDSFDVDKISESIDVRRIEVTIHESKYAQLPGIIKKSIVNFTIAFDKAVVNSAAAKKGIESLKDPVTSIVIPNTCLKFSDIMDVSIVRISKFTSSILDMKTHHIILFTDGIIDRSLEKEQEVS